MNGDRDQISQLVHSYAAGIDAGDLDGVAELFANGEFRSGKDSSVRRGREEVRTMFDGVVLYADGTPRTHHVITNLDIDVAEDATEATARCYFAVLQGVESGTPIETILAGRYVDRFRRREKTWEFAERCVFTDLIGDLSRHYLPAAR
jgi:ketosteroid isomerase-like protein